MMKNTAASAPSSSMPADKPLILVVDDSRLMRVAIKKILKDDFTPLEAIDGEDAWSKLLEEPGIQGVFSDLSMPNLDGYGLLERVRNCEDARIRSLPFVVITGKEGELQGLTEEVRSHGATDLIGKPFKTEEIIQRTKAFLAERQVPAAPEAVPAAEPVAELPTEQQIAEAPAGKPVTAMETPELDVATGLLTRAGFQRSAGRLLEAAIRQNTDLGLLRMQIDALDSLDTEAAREATIRQVSDVVRHGLRNGYCAAHYGHGQFAVLLPECNAVSALRWAKRLLDELASVPASSGVSISGGIDAPLLRPGGSLAELHECAERRMTVARAAGGRRIFNDDSVTLESLAEERRLAEEAARRAAEEEARRKALEEEEARRKAAEAAREEEARRLAEEAEARRQAERDAEARLKAEEAARRRAEEAARLAAEQAEQERLAREEEARQCEAIRETARRLAEENARRQREEEEAKLRFGVVKALFVRMAWPLLWLGNRLLRAPSNATLEALRRRLP